MKGALQAFCEACFVIACLGLAFSFIARKSGWGLDDSDRDTWHRSGMRVLFDAKTGAEYLSDGRGGMVLRESRAESAPHPSN